jgi:hypothetical protein
MDRKSELEQKKAKLEQMRQTKLQKTFKTTQQSPTNGISSPSSDLTSDVDADRILIECGITTPVLTSSSSSSKLNVQQTADIDQFLQHNVISNTSKLLAISKKYATATYH